MNDTGLTMPLSQLVQYRSLYFALAYADTTGLKKRLNRMLQPSELEGNRHMVTLKKIYCVIFSWSDSMDKLSYSHFIKTERVEAGLAG